MLLRAPERAVCIDYLAAKTRRQKKRPRDGPFSLGAPADSLLALSLWGGSSVSQVPTVLAGFF
jgi:hypothetical protein